jgi:extradiol dioxygenase
VIDSLAYIGFTSPNAEAWRSFGPDVLGLELVGVGDDGAVRLRNDDAAQRLVVHPGDADGLAYLGWDTGGPVELAGAITKLEKEHGLEVHRAPELAAERRVADVAWFVDPFGFRHELTWGLTRQPSTFRPGRPLSGFVTGSGGVGHAALIVPDLAEAERFYIEVMGFDLTDRIEVGLSLRFLHCNDRHHSMALVAIPGKVGFHHLMLEVAALDDVGRAFDLVSATDDVAITMGLGRHTNDLTTSFYLRTPSGFDIEYGWGGVLVDTEQPWTAGSYDAMSVWGHKAPAGAPRLGTIRPFKIEVRT